MTSVLGVSVGASAVRLACREAETLDGPIFRSRPLTATLERPEESTTASIEAMLADTAEIRAVGVAYRDAAQVGAVRTALHRLEIDNFRLVPEVTAAIESLEASGELGDHQTLVVYDLGSSGLTITVVDRAGGVVLGSARSERISGDLVDRLIYDHHLELHRLPQPVGEAAQLALAARCREAKEQLSTKGAVCIPGEGGLLLLSQDRFDALIDGPVKASARLTREVIHRSGRTPDAAVLIGGGANIPLIASVVESWLDLPVIVPAQPELVAAEGAALLADAPTDEFSSVAALFRPEPNTADDVRTTVATVGTEQRVEPSAPTRPRRRILIAGGVAIIAAVGLGLGTGLFQTSEPDAQLTGVQQNTPAPPAPEAVPAPPSESAETRPTTEPALSPAEAPPVSDAETEAPNTYQAPPQGAAQVPTVPQLQTSTPEPASNVPAPPEPAPLVPGLPQLQLPALPSPPEIPLPQLPPLPGF